MNGYWASFNWPLFVAFLVVIIIFISYSVVTMKQLNKYGYVGDACEKMMLIYPMIALIIIIISIILYLLPL